MPVPGGHRPRGRPRAVIGEPVRPRVPLRRLLRVASVACGIQFGWALQLSLLTPYVQELGIPHAWSSIIWLCGPLSGLLVQPLVGHLSDRCKSRFGRRRPFIVSGAASIVVAVLIIGFSADIGGFLGDNADRRPRAVGTFVVGFWLLDVANNVTQGPCRALLADLTEYQEIQHRVRSWIFSNDDGLGEALILFFSVLLAQLVEINYAYMIFLSFIKHEFGQMLTLHRPHALCGSNKLTKISNILTIVFWCFSFMLEKDHRRTRVANAYFSLFIAVGNVLGFATGSYSGWFKIFWFTITSSCNANCANLKSAFLLDIIFIAITTYISVTAAQELPLSSSSRPSHISEEMAEPAHAQEAFLWELFGTFRYLSRSIWIILFVTALTWIGWFPFLLFDTDWMGREIYGGEPNVGQNYSAGVRMGAFGLMLNSVVLGITSVLMEKLCRKWGAGFVWGLSNILMSLCFLSMLILSAVVKNMDFLGHDLPPSGVVIAALIVFAILGIPLAITYSVPYALISTRIESLGLGQGLSMGVLNLAIVIPQVIVSLGSGPWDQLFGGGNPPSLAVAAVAAFASGLVAILAIPRSSADKSRVHT